VSVSAYPKINDVADLRRLGERAVYEMLRTGRICGAAADHQQDHE
jgi:hypothetical protein